MRNNHTTSLPIRAAEILDPNPERVTSLVGVRQTTHLTAVPDMQITTISAATAPTSFAASFQPMVTTRRRFALPIASTLITISGQAALGALMAAQTVEPVLGLAIFVGWLTCGLALIFAQCAALRTVTDSETLS